MRRLEQTVSVVTGAASGIGAACAERLSAEGAIVSTIDVAPGVDHVLDVRDEVAVRAAFDAVVAEHGRLDSVVHAAGVAGGGPVHLLEAEEWDRVIDVNLKGTFLVDKYSSMHMLAQGSGSIVNIARIEGIEGTEGGSAYNASKGGVVMLTKSMAVDYGRAASGSTASARAASTRRCCGRSPTRTASTSTASGSGRNTCSADSAGPRRSPWPPPSSPPRTPPS